MHVLVLESDVGAAQGAVARLERAGHEVSRCHDPGAEPFPCRGLTGTCPLDRGDVDVVLTVRDDLHDRPACREAGVLCGLRRRIPLVVVDKGVPNHSSPYRGFATTTLADVAEVVTACETIVQNPLPRLSRVATDAVREVLSTHGLDDRLRARAHVYRRAGRLSVEVVDVPADAPTGMLTTRVLGALRAFDPYAAGIDVAVRQPDGGMVPAS